MGLVWAVREDLWRYFGQFGKLEMVQVCELIVLTAANLYSLSLSCTVMDISVREILVHADQNIQIIWSDRTDLSADILIHPDRFI